MSEMIRVNNTRPTILHLPDKISIPADAKPDNAAAYIEQVGTGRSLSPGGHNLTTEEWAGYKRHHVVREWLRLKWLVESDETSKPEGVETPESLTSYKTAAAVALVDMEENAETLRRWMDADTRLDVKNAIRAKLDGVKVVTKSKGR